MKNWVLLVLAAGLAACSQAPSEPSEVETRVHQKVEEMMKEEDGSVVFSDLHNSKELSAEERDYLDRLYEVFFALPRVLSERIASRRQNSEGGRHRARLPDSSIGGATSPHRHDLGLTDADPHHAGRSIR